MALIHIFSAHPAHKAVDERLQAASAEASMEQAKYCTIASL
ncbi:MULTISPECIES: hypothetical protein [Pantoea]|nr:MULTISPECIES: hypothetical protein [Pantoea]MDH2069879.1 hypothetical protein [Pantoea sp. GD03673]